MDTDTLLGTTAGLLGVAILAGVASKALEGSHHHQTNAPKLKPVKKAGKMKW